MMKCGIVDEKLGLSWELGGCPHDFSSSISTCRHSLFITYFWLCRVFIAVRGPPLHSGSEQGLLSVGVQGLRVALERPGSVAVAPGLHVASGHVGIFLGQGSNLCPCTDGGLLTTAPLGKPLKTRGFCLPASLFSAPSAQLGVSAFNGRCSPVSTPATSSVLWRGPRAHGVA